MLHENIKKILKKEIILKRQKPIYLETGFSKGVSALDALQLGFSKVISIELDQNLINEGKKKFKNYIDNGSLIIIQGDSSEKIIEIFDKKIDAIFLDAHGQFQSGNNKIISAPLEKELQFLKDNLHDKQIVIIDDFIKINNSEFFTNDNWKSKFNKNEFKKIVSQFNRKTIEYPYEYYKNNSLIRNSYLILFNKDYENKINKYNLLIKKIYLYFSFFNSYGINFLKRKIKKIISNIFGENFYKKLIKIIFRR